MSKPKQPENRVKIDIDYRGTTLFFGDRISESQQVRFRKAQGYHTKR